MRMIEKTTLQRGPPADGGPSVLVGVLLITTAVLAAYATSIPGDFVWIDHVEIEQGGYRLLSGEDFPLLLTMTLDQYLARDEGEVPSSGGYWRPAYAVSVTLDWWLWGATAWACHVENTLWHLAVAIGLLFLGRRYVADERAVFWATLLFAVHPLGVHSVTWISGRKDAMCALFGIAALLAFAQALERQSFRRAARWCAAAFVLAIASALSKELGMVVAAAAGLLLWCRWPRLSKGGRRRSVGLLGCGTLLLVPIGVALYRAAVLGGFGLNARYPSHSVLGNVATSSTLLWEYIGRVLLPRPPSISDAWPISHAVGPLEIAAIIGLAGALLATVVGLYRRRQWAVASLWTIIWLLPATGVIPLRHVRAERYLYPASWGLLLIAVLVILWLVRRVENVSWGRTARFILPAACLWAILITGSGNVKWWDDETLFRDATARDPHFVEGWTGLAELAYREGEYRKAIEYGQKAVEEAGNPDYAAYYSPFVTHTNLGLAYYHAQEHQAAFRELIRALSHSPNSGVAHYHVGMATFALGDYALAGNHYARSLELRPGDFLTASNLAATRLRLGDFQTCLELLEPLVEQRPEDAINRTNLASVLLATKRYEDATPHFEYLVEKNPKDALAWGKLAWCQWETDQRELARTSWKRAYAIAPELPAVRYVGEVLGVEVVLP